MTRILCHHNQEHFDNMRENGYTVIEPTPETIELADKIRAETLQMMAEQRNRPDKKEGDEQLDRQAPKLLGRGALQEDGRTLYERFLMLPQQAILAEYMCGAGFLVGYSMGAANPSHFLLLGFTAFTDHMLVQGRRT